MEPKGKQKLKEKPVIIFANAPIPPEKFIRKYIENAGMIVCADGGANRIKHLKIHPDVIIGDLDSITHETLNSLQNVTIVRKPEQDSTDLQKALEYVEYRGAQHIIIFGASGGRPDHVFGNISLLARFNERLSIEMIDEWCTIKLVPLSGMTITGTLGQKVSLYPLSEKAEGITTTGLKYPLKNETLFQGTRGISNEFSSSEASIKVRGGNLLIFIHHHGKH